MKDSGIEWIGEIPEDWEVVRLGKIARFQNGYAFKESDLIDPKDNYVIRIGDLKNRIDISEKTLKTNLSDMELEPYRIKNKDILIAMSGATVGKIIFNTNSNKNLFINQRVGIIRSDLNFLIKYYLKINVFLEYVFLSSQGSAQPNISSGQILNYSISLPPKDQQEKIANFLDQKVGEIDRLIEKTKEVIGDYKSYKQSIITETVSKGLRKDVALKDSGIEWIGEIPEHWEVIKGKYIFDLMPKCKKNKLDDNVKVTFLPMENVKNGYFINNIESFSKNNSSYVEFENEDIIIAKVTPCFENGNIALLKNLSNGFGFGSSELFVIRCKNDILNRYMFYIFQNINFVHKGCSTMTGTGGLKRVSSKFVEGNFYTIPPLDEQKEIAAYLDEKCGHIDRIIETKEGLIKELEAYKKSLIYETVTGKREVD